MSTNVNKRKCYEKLKIIIIISATCQGNIFHFRFDVLKETKNNL